MSEQARHPFSSMVDDIDDVLAEPVLTTAQRSVVKRYVPDQPNAPIDLPEMVEYLSTRPTLEERAELLKVLKKAQARLGRATAMLQQDLQYALGINLSGYGEDVPF